MGRDRLSDDEKRKRGTFQPVRAEKTAKVVPLSRMPLAPDWLCDEAVRIWREQGPKLLREGLLGETDVHSFARYCQFSGMYERLMSELKAESWVLMMPNGISAPNPKFKMALDCQNKADVMGRQFGFSPASRKNVPKQEKKTENPFQTLKSGTNG